MTLIILLLGAILVLLNSSAHVLMKKGVTGHLPVIWKNYKLLAGYGVMLLVTVLTLIFLKYAQVKSFILVSAVNYLVVCIFSKIFLNETLTRKQMTGVVLIVFGALIFQI